MSTNQNDDVTTQHAAWIRGCLREVASTAERVVRNVTTAEVSSTSSAYSQWVGVLDLLGEDASEIFTRGHNSVHLVILAAADHIKMFVGAVGGPGTTISTATLTRAAVEALAKAFYLLSAADVQMFLQRHVALQEYEFAGMKNNAFQDDAGVPIDGVDYIAELRDVLATHEIPPPHLQRDGINLTSMVRELLDASAEIDTGLSRTLYSQLSSVAHANTSAVAMYVHNRGDGPRLRLPRELALEQAAMNIGTLAAVVDRYVAHYEPPTISTRAMGRCEGASTNTACAVATHTVNQAPTNRPGTHA